MARHSKRASEPGRFTDQTAGRRRAREQLEATGGEAPSVQDGTEIQPLHGKPEGGRHES